MSKKSVKRRVIFKVHRHKKGRDISKSNQRGGPKKHFQNPKLFQYNVNSVETPNFSTSINTVLSQPMTEEATFNYYSKSLVNNFNTYARSRLENLVKREILDEKINEKILANFGLDKDLRKFAFKYLSRILDQYNIPIKYYFHAIKIFDKYLVKYSKIVQNKKKSCSEKFISKKTQKFSKMKLILFILCCFYIANQIYNSKNMDIKCLLNWSQEDEMTTDEINELVCDILNVTDFGINDVGIFDYIDILSFDLNQKLKILSNGNVFISALNNNIYCYSMKLTQDISLVNIKPSMQALGVTMFIIEYTKFYMSKVDNIEKMNYLISNWILNVKSFFPNYNYDEIKFIINWLNTYVQNHS